MLNNLDYNIEVSVETRFIDDDVEILIRDTGIGISNDHIDHVFDRFYRVVYKPKISIGSGIGLSLVKNLVDLHHGSIEVKSVVNSGTVFKVALPVKKEKYNPFEIALQPQGTMVDYVYFKEVAEKDNAPVDIEEEDKQIIPSNKLRLLIIDDSAALRLYLKEIFKDSFRVETAGDGEQGLKRILEIYPDIIISDVMMPKMTGIELCGKLKADERIGHIPIILLTARASDEYQIIGFETGADAYIVKPFNAKILIARVLNLLESRQKMRSYFSRSSFADSTSVAPTNSDEQFLKRTMKVVESNFTNEEFDAEQLAKELGVGRSILYAKIKALTEQTVHEFIKLIRLKKAALLLTTTDLIVKEIAFQVGFKNPRHFMQCFKDHYGLTSSEYRKQNKKID
ncbi:MAG: response regulator [Salinivirgaceae bacterium]|jgi:DNA-binding response OmpR family regulator|nr:response regulator [Salinivirgaceae bacterium]